MARKKKAARSSPRPREVGEERRRQLLEAAFEIVAEKGLEGLRTRDVVDRAGVNVSTLHYYFGTKDALLVALVDHVSDKFANASRSPDDPKPWRESPSLRAHFEAGWNAFRSNPGLSTVLQELAQRSRRDPATREAFEAMHRGWAEVVEGVLRGGIESGQLRTDLDPTLTARVIISFVMGGMTQLEAAPNAFDIDAAACELERWLAR